MSDTGCTMNLPCSGICPHHDYLSESHYDERKAHHIYSHYICHVCYTILSFIDSSYPLICTY
jgi:hypothetical protein